VPEPGAPIIKMGFIGLARKRGGGSTCLFACVCVKRCVSLSVCVILFYGRKHRPCEELNAGADRGKPFSQPGAASACWCSGIATIVIATNPSNPNAAIMAITAIDTFLSSRDEWFIFC
jgi:hypothetical protein